MAGLLETALDADAIYTKDKIIGYVRGECLETGVTGNTDCVSGATADSNFRDRRVPIDGVDKVWKLGDIIHSTPKQMGGTPNNAYISEYGDASYLKYVTQTSYRDRSAIAMVGANDGMLHAFRVGYLKDRDFSPPVSGLKALYEDFKGLGTTGDIGEEVWGFIPFNAFPYLKYLADPDYCHIYYNDLPIKVVDASLGAAGDDATTPKDAGNPNASWRTVVIGGMRYGGTCSGGPAAPLPGVEVGFSSYYAIDITDPANPVPLWEFSDADLGYAAGAPAVIRTGARGNNGRWYVAIGSGSTQLPKANTDIGRSTNGQVYILDMETGAQVEKIDLGYNAIVGGMLPIDADRNYHSETIYFGTSYKDATGAWKGKLTKLDIPDDNLASASVSANVLFNDAYPFTATPEAARYDAQKVWVYAGSGKYLSEVDEGDTSAQIFIGIKDTTTPSAPLATPLTASSLVDNTALPVQGTVLATKDVCLYDDAATPPQFDKVKVVTEVARTSALIPEPTTGWRIPLTTGERVITRPLSVGGLVDFISYTPSADLCAFGGNSKVYVVEYLNGAAPANIALRSPDITSGGTNIGDVVTVSSHTGAITGAPPPGEGIIMLPPKDGDDTLQQKIQIGTTEILEAEVKPPISLFTTVMHWMKR